MMTVHEVAQHLRVSVRTVWRLLASGALPRVKVAGSTRVPAAAVRDYTKPKTA